INQPILEVIQLRLIKIKSSITHNVRNARSIGNDRGSAAGHRLEWRQAKAFVKRRIYQAHTAAIEFGQMFVSRLALLFDMIAQLEICDMFSLVLVEPRLAHNI